MDSVSILPATPGTFRLKILMTPVRLAAGLTLFALALRLIGLGSRPLWLDEAFSAWFSDRSFHYLWTVLPTYEAHPPLYYTILKTWRGVVGGGHLEMRALSVLLGTLTIPVIIVAAFEQERQQPCGQPMLRAGIAGFLAACSPALIVLDQEARPYPMLTLAYAVAILSLLRLRREFGRGEAGSWTWWLTFAAAAELVLWSHALGFVYGFFLALAVLPVWLGSGAGRARLTRGLATAALVVLAYLPCLVMIGARSHDWGTTWLQWRPGDLVFNLAGLYTVSGEALTIGSAVAALATLLLIKRSLVSTYVSEGWNPDRLLLLLWLGPPLLAALISALLVPIFLPRTLSPTLIPAYLALAGALARTEGPRERRLLTAAICIALTPAALSIALRPASERWDLAAAYLARNVEPADQVWLYPADSALPLGEIGRPIPGKVRAIPKPFPTLGFDGPARAGWPAVVSVTPEQADALASDPSIRKVPVVWLVTRQSDIFDPRSDLPRALARARRAGQAEQWGYIEVRPYYPR
jgi:mannosyltransferase